ncbi:hypothetical protein BsWGS_17004 [Bradybaena similaris]
MAPAPPKPPPPPGPPPPPTLRKGPAPGGGPGAPRKWAPVQTDRPEEEKHHVDIGHMGGYKLPALVVPSTKERAKIKVFRFLKKKGSPKEEEGSACGIDQSPVADESPLQARSDRRQPMNLPQDRGSGGMSFLEELKMKTAAVKQKAKERQEQSQQTQTSPEFGSTASPRAQRTFPQRQVAASEGPIHGIPPQYVPDLETTEQPKQFGQRAPRVPGPPQLRLGPHKHATPATQQPPELEDDVYVNLPLRGQEINPDTGVYENLPPIPPRTYENLPPRALGRNAQPNSQGIFPPSPPSRARNKEGPPLQADGSRIVLPSPPTWLRQPDQLPPTVILPSPPPLSPEQSADLAVDAFVGSQNVIGLNEQNFDYFIAPKQLAMVMYYDPSNPNSLQPKEHFKKAADSMGRGNGQFAAVDCNVLPRFCVNQGVTMMPTFKIFSLGKVLSTIREVSRFDDKEMRQYMETLSEIQPQGQCTGKAPDPNEPKCSLAKRLGFKK